MFVQADCRRFPSKLLPRELILHLNIKVFRDQDQETFSARNVYGFFILAASCESFWFLEIAQAQIKEPF
jgi:hypothetical protein